MTHAICTPAESLARLKRGNADFLADTPVVVDADHAQRLAVAREQRPFAALVGCSDSRVPPELLFGVSLGEIFIIRNAGNTVDPIALGSVEYAVLVLGVPLIVVLGHQRCGAVTAAVDAVVEGTIYPGSIGRVVDPIIPAVLEAQRTGATGDDLVDASVRANVRRIVARLRHDEPYLGDPQREGRLRVVGATYLLDTGVVDFFDD